jgi:hypothetical protein
MPTTFVAAVVVVVNHFEMSIIKVQNHNFSSRSDLRLAKLNRFTTMLAPELEVSTGS